MTSIRAIWILRQGRVSSAMTSAGADVPVKRGRRALEAAVVVAAAILLVSLLVWWDGADVPLRSDQLALNAMVLKMLHPDWFRGDPLYEADRFAFYTPGFLSLQATMTRWLDGDPRQALVILVWPIGVLFIVAHYALFRSLVGSRLAAALGVVAALTVRHALGGEYWGFDGVRAVQARTIAVALVPLLVLAFLRWRGRPLFPAWFFLAGVTANVHPVTAFHLYQVATVSHLWLERFRGSAWRDAALGAALFVLGALPFIVHYLPGKENLTDPAASAVVREAIAFRFDYLLLPQKPEALLSVGMHAALPAGLLLWLRWRGGWSPDLRPLGVLGVVALVLGFAGTAAFQAASWASGRPPLDIMQLRATKLMYLPLLAAFPLTFGALMARRSRAAVAGFAAVLLLSLVPPASMIHAVPPERRDAVKRLLGMSPPALTEVSDDAEATAARAALLAWIRDHTAPPALVFTDLDDVRFAAYRPITGSFKDGAYFIITGTAPFYRWYRYVGEVQECRSRQGRDCWLPLAARHGATYAVMDPGLEPGSETDGFVRVWTRSGWSVWQRMP